MNGQMAIQIKPSNQPLPVEELDALIGGGWACMPNVLLRSGATGIAKLNDPAGGVGVYNIWYRPVPTMPMTLLLNTIAGLAQWRPHHATLDALCQGLFQRGLAEVAAQVGGTIDAAAG